MNTDGRGGFDIFDMVADVVMAKQQSWRQRAACRGGNLDTFYPKQHYPGLNLAASTMCSSCEVSKECKKEWESMPVAMRRHGFWFGTTDKDRREQGL